MRSTAAIVLGILVLIFFGLSLFIVKETEYAVKFRLGEIVRSDYGPGLHWKMPLINNVKKFDRRILLLDMPVEQMNTREQKYVDVDYYINWHIVDVERYYTSTSGGDERIARDRLAQIIRDRLRERFASLTLQEVVAERRAELMTNLTRTADERMAEFGIKVIDVRIKRIELTERVTDSVFSRMETQRTQFANELRSVGRERAEKIRADADRQVRILLAEADRDAERIRGEGDAQAAEIYAAAYRQDEEFYSFTRSLEAYSRTFDGSRDMLVIDPTLPFYDHLRSAPEKRK